MPPSNPSELVKRMRQDSKGRSDALESLRFELLKTAATISPSSADDVVQDALILAHDKFDQFRGTTDAELRGWLRVIVRNCCLASLRRSRPHQSIEAEHALIPAESNSSPSKNVRAAEERAQLIVLLERLTPEQREVLSYRYWEGWTGAQIANQLQKSETAVAGLLKRAHEKLRTLSSESDWSRLLNR